MADRRDLINAQNTLRDQFNQTQLDMKKAGATPEQLSRLNSMFQKRSQDLLSSFGDDLQQLNLGKKIPIQGGTAVGVDLDQTRLPDAAKQTNLGKEGMFKKSKDIAEDVSENIPDNVLSMARKKGLGKIMGALPVVGGLANAFMSGDASAAIPGLGDTESAGPAEGSVDDQIQKGQMAGPEIQAQMEQARAEMLKQSPNEEEPRQFQLSTLKRLLQKNK